MSQDTRKDKRAKVVSLNVRYKSATVDEFIENHSHDVSKGGIFVKTPTPFPPGTLLKFEIRLAGDKSVISGVGRVVWKREPTQASPEKPAGMGVKFIKIDDASRAVIDRLIAQKADAGSAYTSDPAALEEEKAPAGQPTTLRGIPAAPAAGAAPAPAPAPAAAPPPTAAKPAAAPPAATPAAKPFPAPASSTPGAKVGATGATATAKPLPGGAAGSAMAKTMPLGTSPLQSGQTMPGVPKPTPGSPGTPAATPARAGGPPPPMANKPATAIGIGPSPTTAKPAVAAPPPAAAPPAATGAPVAPASQPRIGAAPAPRPPAVNARKATMMGVGLPAPSSAPGADKAGTGSPLDKLFETSPVSGAGTGGSHDPHDIPTPLAEITPMGVPVEPKTGSGANPMFPKQASEKDFDSVKEPTVMKQAAELLEEALREAGGSIDEIGQNPLFSKSSQRGGAVEEKRPSTPDLHQSGDTLMMSSPLKGAHGAPTPAPPQASVTPSPSASVTPSPAQSQPPPSVQHYDRPAAAKPLSESIREAEKKKGGAGGLIAGLLVIAVLVGGGVYAYKSGMLASVLGETPVPSAAPTPTPTPSAAPTPTPSTSDSAALATTDASTTSSGDAAASTDGSAASATATDGGANAAGADAAAAMAKDAGAAGALTAVVKPPPPPPPPQPKPKPKPPPPPPDTDSTSQPSPPSTPTKDPTPAPTPAPTATDNP